MGSSMFVKNSRFTELFDIYYPMVFSAVITKVDNPDDAEDICQEVFISMYNKLDEIEDVRKWLYGTLRYEVLGYYRKKNRNLSMDDVFDNVALTFVNGFRDTRILIDEVLEKESAGLDETERELLELISIYKYSYEEAGKLTGLTKRQVRYRYGLIVDRVLDSLSKQGIKSLEELL
jgi:RNA polymerase sigma-70 factor, ECF subfamily